MSPCRYGFPLHHFIHFGFNLPWWDYLLGTYQAQPAEGHEGMTIGLSQFRDDRVDQLHWMLALRFIGQVGNYPLNRRGGGEKPTGCDTSQVALASSRRQPLRV